MPHLRFSDYCLLDMDGPLADFDKATWGLAERKGLRSLTGSYDPEQQTHRFMTDHIHRRDRGVIRDAINSPDWFYNLEPTEGAAEGVERLLDAADAAGMRVVVCTKPLATSPTCTNEKLAWLSDHFPALSKTVTIVPDKSLMQGAFLLDDAIPPAWLSRASWSPVIFDRPYNRDGSPWEGWHRWSWDRPLSELHARLAEGEGVGVDHSECPICGGDSVPPLTLVCRSCGNQAGDPGPRQGGKDGPAQ